MNSTLTPLISALTAPFSLFQPTIFSLLQAKASHPVISMLVLVEIKYISVVTDTP
jgi:hypothetical protein